MKTMALTLTMLLVTTAFGQEKKLLGHFSLPPLNPTVYALTSGDVHIRLNDPVSGLDWILGINIVSAGGNFRVFDAERAFVNPSFQKLGQGYVAKLTYPIVDAFGDNLVQVNHHGPEDV